MSMAGQHDIKSASAPVDILDTSFVVWGLIGLAVLLSVLTLLGWRKHKHEIRFVEYCKIHGRPATLFHYIGSTFFRHSLEYLGFVGLPLALGIIFKVSILSLWAIWAFLFTAMSAFYAARADYSSSSALEEAKATYRSVINFAENLESFVEKVKHDLDSLKESVTLKFLTVIPAFASVGLTEHYRLMKDIDRSYRTLHQTLSDRIRAGKVRKLLLLTHDGRRTVDWLFNILYTSRKDEVGLENSKVSVQAVVDKVKEIYFDQKKYARDLIGEYGQDRLDWRLWDTARIPKLRDEPLVPIPFQFLIVTQASLRRVYFLFSGSYLYDFVFKAVDLTVGMSSLVTLTKGYYVEKDQELITIFEAIFDSFFGHMDTLTKENLDSTYPNRIEFVANSSSWTVDIEGEYTTYEKQKGSE